MRKETNRDVMKIQIRACLVLAIVVAISMTAVNVAADITVRELNEMAAEITNASVKPVQTHTETNRVLAIELHTTQPNALKTAHRASQEHTATPSANPSRYAELELSDKDKELLARIVKLEAGGEYTTEPFEGLVAVVEVVLNRLLDSRFPDTVYDVLYQPKQFSPASLISVTMPDEINYKAVNAAVDGLHVVSPETVFFSTKAITSSGVTQIGSHFFSE